MNIVYNKVRPRFHETYGLKHKHQVDHKTKPRNLGREDENLGISEGKMKISGSHN